MNFLKKLQVPTKAPHMPAAIPKAALARKPGGFPSSENVSNNQEYTPNLVVVYVA